MPNTYFRFKQFTVYHDRCAMKVTTDGCLFGAWVAAQIGGHTGAPLHLLDIGTGTGLLSLMIAQKNAVLIDAVEIDPEAAKQAGENVAASPWSETIRIINEDILQWQQDKKFDVIVANPPFYENELRSGKKSKNVAHHDEGLKLPELFGFIQGHLHQEGVFFLLLPAKREAELDAFCENHQLYWQKKVRVKQTVHHAAFRLLLQGGRQKPAVTVVEEFAIKNATDQYTPEFTALLKEYYLYL